MTLSATQEAHKYIFICVKTPFSFEDIILVNQWSNNTSCSICLLNKHVHKVTVHTSVYTSLTGRRFQLTSIIKITRVLCFTSMASVFELWRSLGDLRLPSFFLFFDAIFLDCYPSSCFLSLEARQYRGLWYTTVLVPLFLKH